MSDDFDGNPFGDPCPCCSGLREWNDLFDLCDGCIAAALANVWPHGCPGDAVRVPEPHDSGSGNG